MRSVIYDEIDDERERQDEVWGEQNHGDEWWLAIASEEAGEVAQAILQDQFGGPHAGTVKAELIQLTAVLIAWLECRERRDNETGRSVGGAVG